MRELVAEKLDDNRVHVLYARKFYGRPTADRAKSPLGFDWTCVGVQQQRVNIRRAIVMTATMTSCLTALLAEKKHAAYCALIESRFSLALLQESFTSKW